MLWILSANGLLFFLYLSLLIKFLFDYFLLVLFLLWLRLLVFLSIFINFVEVYENMESSMPTVSRDL